MDDDETYREKVRPAAAGALTKARSSSLPEVDVLIHHLGLDTMVFDEADGQRLVIVPDGPET